MRIHFHVNEVLERFAKLIALGLGKLPLRERTGHAHIEQIEFSRAADDLAVLPALERLHVRAQKRIDQNLVVLLDRL